MCRPRAGPKDGRYGENPNRLQHYYQFQVIMKPSPADSQDLYLGLLEGHRHRSPAARYPLRRGRLGKPDAWAPGAWAGKSGATAWKSSQFTYFQQVGGLECNPVSTELTYGLERLAMYVQGVESIYDLDYNGHGMTYGDVFLQSEQEYSTFNFERANTEYPAAAFRRCREGMRGACWAATKLCRCRPMTRRLKASHLFNLLDARGVISVTERQAYIGRVRTLAKACCEAWEATQQTQIPRRERRKPWPNSSSNSSRKKSRPACRRVRPEDLQRLVTDKLKAAGLDLHVGEILRDAAPPGARGRWTARWHSRM